MCEYQPNYNISTLNPPPPPAGPSENVAAAEPLMATSGGAAAAFKVPAATGHAVHIQDSPLILGLRSTGETDTHDYYDKDLSRKGAAPATGRDTLI